MPEGYLFTTLLDAVRARLVPGQRLLVGIAGPPGAGKSTLASELVSAVPQAAMVPMDGFHLSNGELARLGRSHRKGAPDTFDDAGYVALLERLRARSPEMIYAPSFDHVMNEPIAGSIPIPPSAELIVTEGNYLLHWERARELLDLAVFIDCTSQEQRVSGLIARQIDKGLTPSAAEQWVMRSDEANARLVQSGAHLADINLFR